MRAIHFRLVGMLVIGALILMSVKFLDLPIARFFHEIRAGMVVGLAAATTDAGLAVWYLVAAAVVFAVAHFVLKRRPIAVTAAFLFVSVAASGIAADVLKVIFGRTRPKLLFREDLYEFHWFKFGANWNSFPSGHSTTVAAVTMALCLLVPRWWPVFIPLGIALVATRVITTAHYLSDALFGATLGTATTILVYRLFQRRGWLSARPAFDRGDKP